MTRDEYQNWNRLFRLARAQEMKARGHGNDCFTAAMVCLMGVCKKGLGGEVALMLLHSSGGGGVASWLYSWTSWRRYDRFIDLKQKRAAA